MFLRIGDFDRDSNHDADCDIGDLCQTHGDNKDDGDDRQNGEQSVKEKSLVFVPLERSNELVITQDSCVRKVLKTFLDSLSPEANTYVLLLK